MKNKNVTDEPLDVTKIEVFYDDDIRRVKCSCGKICNRTIIPHLKKDHPEDWKKWCSDFVRLYNRGWSVKRIMWKYRVLFTWTLIERIIRNSFEKDQKLLKVNKKTKLHKWSPQVKDFELPNTTVWDFPDRGNWATHEAKYRGNWAPQIPRSLILKYSKEGDVVLDSFVGGGTTLIEAWLNNRKSIGIDINPTGIKITKKRIKEMENENKSKLTLNTEFKPIIKQGNASDSIKILSKLGFSEGSINLICTHPPYLDALKYTKDIQGDLSRINDVELFCSGVQEIAATLYKLLKIGGYCAILMGDTRKRKSITPLGFLVMDRFLKEKFQLEDIIIKLQHKDKSNEFYYNKNFIKHPIAHEYLFIFKK